MTETLNIRDFLKANGAKDLRDKVVTLYDELLCARITDEITVEDTDALIRRFIRKVATHALNGLQETREDFMKKYLSKYHQKIHEHHKKKREKHMRDLAV